MKSDIKHATMLEALFDAAVDSIIIIDSNGIIQSVNRSAERLFGYESTDIIGASVNLLMPEPWASQHDHFIRHYQQSGHKTIIGIGREVEGKRKDNSIFPMHLSVSEYWVDGQAYYSGSIHDLTAKKQAQKTLAQAQKMEAIGQLTGGIAHDFNNILTVITGNLELLTIQKADNNRETLIEEALEAAELGAKLTERLLAFARRSVLEPEVFNLNLLVEDITGLLRRTLGSNIKLTTTLQDDIWQASIDRGQLESAMLNLAVNAKDAMARIGNLMIETKNITVNNPYEANRLGLKVGDYVCVCVSDTGTGMPEEVLAQAFEPFFTTKEQGKGTGLGLSMVYGFAKQSGGQAAISSNIEQGTTVSIYLPRHQKNQAI